MKYARRSAVAIAMACCACLASAPASSQPARTFVAAQGSDGNPCTFAAPCRTFQHAHDVTAAGGEIDVLDPAGYGAVVITKSISIQGHKFSGISTTSGATAVTINAGATDIVNLSGLLIDGAGVGTTGIQFSSGGTLTIDQCVVRNFFGTGINFAPNVSSTLSVSNTASSDNYTGVQITPLAAASVSVVLSNMAVTRNLFAGVGVDGSDTTAASLNVTVTGSLISTTLSPGGIGVSAQSTTPGRIAIMLKHTTLTGNNIGLSVTAADVRLSRTVITGNTSAISLFGFVGEQHVYSYSNNDIDGNGNNNLTALTATAQR